MPHDLDDLDWVLLTRYLTGDLSPAELHAVEQWFEADPRHRALLNELRSVWSLVAGDTSGWDTDRAVAELRRRVERGSRRPAVAGSTHFADARRRSWLSWAAGVAALAAGVAGFLVLPRSSSNSVPAAEVATRRGQQAEVRLADGTKVTLHPASRLQYPRDFGRGDRTVTLRGEAHFEVTHDPSRRFAVLTTRGAVEDIGTAFVVRAYEASPLQVVVTDGAVVLRRAAAPSLAPDSLVLTRGQLGRVMPDGELFHRARVNPDVYLAWTQGELAFQETALTEVAEELSRWYDADVRVADAALGRRHFTGRLSHRTLEEAVRLVGIVTDVSVRRTPAGWRFQ